MELSFRRLVTRHDSRERKENRDPADMKERVPGHWVTTPQVLSLSWASGFLVLRLRDQRILHAPWREKNLRPRTQRLTRDREHQWPSRPPGTGTGALSLGVNLLSREGNSQKWRMKDNKSHFWQVTFTWGRAASRVPLDPQEWRRLREIP